MSTTTAKENFPTDASLINKYAEIEQDATERILSGKVSENDFYLQPLYKRLLADTRYSISTQILLSGSPVYPFLTKALKEVKTVEPGFQNQPDKSLHITVMELVNSEVGKKAAGVTADGLRKYRQALFLYLPDHHPVNFRLYRIFPTLDKAPEGQNPTVSLVASFLTDDNPTLFMVRSQFEEVVDTYNKGIEDEKQRLKFNPGNPNIDVVLVTLGKFGESPYHNGHTPILDTLRDINQQIPAVDGTLEFSRFNLITTAIGYALGPYLLVEPAIYLEKAARIVKPIRLVIPSRGTEGITATTSSFS